ncbi:TraK domain-containing protein [Vibrio coralliilyticus]|uniref:Uncharacterized protein n=1 Tax=Vibrio coralliilyticus TaxID=190893 RepID=A0AAP6ZNH1_9VIBR|nr:type-F conjugative transfer system secretin TraK [Vibrio coralliilyticus]NOI31836.1 hypothetical protein [Vibrio coralliilyticus]NOJ25280.1 hypothetical protein [Vibrio coralliilyticus]
MIRLKGLATFVIASCIVMPTHATKLATFEKHSTAPAESQKVLHVISNQYLNRIVTPFKSPSIKLIKPKGVSTEKSGNVLYLATNRKTKIAAFITEGGDESTAIKVLFSPEAIGPQEIVLGNANHRGSEIARRLEHASPRTDALVNIMSSLAIGNLPSGYQQQEVNAAYFPECSQKNLSFEFYNGQFFSGGDYVVSIGIAKNKTNHVLELKENTCYKDGVVAVSGYPDYTIPPHSSVEVLVMYHRAKPTMRKVKQRQSLIGQGQQ